MRRWFFTACGYIGSIYILLVVRAIFQSDNGKVMRINRINRYSLSVFTLLLAIYSHGIAAFSHDNDGRVSVIKCGQLLDVDQRVVSKNVMVLVEGAFIAAVAKNVDIPIGAKIIDLSDRVCLPGLMDMHVHLMSTDETGINFNKSSVGFVLTAVHNIQKLLNHGFTTIRVPGDRDYEWGLVELRNSVNTNLIAGPRMLVAGHSLGDESYVREKAKRRGASANKNEIMLAGALGARNAVRREVRHGSDWIKLSGDTGGFPGSVKRILTDEQIHAAAHEAHHLGARITAHIAGDETSRVAALSGLDSIEHGFFISETTAQLMKERGTYLVPTLGVAEVFWDLQKSNLMLSKRGGMSPLEISDWKLSITDARKNRDRSFKYAYKIGVKMAYGSDQTNPYMASREFYYLTRLGVTLWDAIAMATINSADLLGMKEKIGSIAVGKFADIVALPKNPLNDIEALEKVNFVMKSGVVIRHD